MKKFFLLAVLLCLRYSLSANEPDNGYLFSYQNGRGLAFAYSSDGNQWTSIGNGRTFVDSDFGTWGAEKKMHSPYLLQGADGLWRCVWSPNERNNQFAYCQSPDLINWKPQDYPYVTGNCRQPVLTATTQGWTVSYRSNADTFYRVSSADCRHWTAAAALPADQYPRYQYTTIHLDNRDVQGQQHLVRWEVIDRLVRESAYRDARQKLLDERMEQDPVRFAGLQPVEARLTVDAAQSKSISDKLLGIFFEDISYAADGGLYGELVQNRDFEYSPTDKKGSDPHWNSLTAWSLQGEGSSMTIETGQPVHAHNPHYLALTTQQSGTALCNSGYDGISVRKGAKYNVSAFLRKASPKSTQLVVSLVDEHNQCLGSTTLTASSSNWKKVKATLKANADARKARLCIAPQDKGSIHLDMVSLFPQATFKNRENGLRADLAQTLADLKPKFVRFPGGCVAHGDGLHNMYLWKNTIGPLEERIPMRNLWGYHQTLGLGYYEYFLFCEDIGAEPLPVLPAGVPCQNSSDHGHGQQGGVPLDSMSHYIQDILDLIEWANGDAKTTRWGRLRAQSGHPKPFNLKYIGIGNEDLISDVFTERFTLIFNAIKEQHPEITVCGTVGPFYEGSDYQWGWDLATQLGVPMVDEHYYVSPGWFIHNQDYYDHYDRHKAKVYLGEYACHLPGRPNCLESALCEALHLTTLERNGDVVAMSSYAPLLARDGHTNWNPDMIYFNSTDIRLTPGYYAQQMCGTHAGDHYLSSRLQVQSPRADVQKRVAVSTVTDSATGDLLIKLVNLLPVSVSTQVNIANAQTFAPQATCTVLTGKPADRQVTPQVSQVEVSDAFSYTLPAYSFTTLRLTPTAAAKK